MNERAIIGTKSINIDAGHFATSKIILRPTFSFEVPIWKEV